MRTLSAIIQESGLTLSEIHRRTGVSRTTLSRITNGRQAPSPKTARKLASLLDVSAKEIMQTSSTQSAAPEILRVSANRLSQWGQSRRAEEELPQLVSRLIRSELFTSGFIRAPSDERIIEPGPDIAVNTPRKTRHIPRGPSVWEVSTRSDVRDKVLEDIGRLRVPTGWRPEATSFVFVTTMPWSGADEFASRQLAEHPWLSVTILDATDLQSWIEESLGVQLWLMKRMGLEREGFQWLREAVREWGFVAEPPLKPLLLKESVEKQFTTWRAWVHSTPNKPLTIIGESKGEVLLFVQSLIEHGDSNGPQLPIEGLCVRTKEGVRQIAASPLNDVVVIPTSDEARELAVACCTNARVILPTTGQPRVADPLVVFPAGRTHVRDYLIGEGCDSGRASQLARSSGGSVSVLRRLTLKAGIEAPDFQTPSRLSPILAAAGLFGIWDAGSVADRAVALRLTGQRCDEDLEKAWTELLSLDETPVWMDGGRRGVNSRLDTWQRFTEEKITPQTVDRYFDVVGQALSEAPLNRPGKHLLLPDAYQALRDSQVSGELLRGLAQGLILLAEFGDRIDPRLVGPPVSKRLEQVVFEALKDLTVERLQALHTVLPHLAEAAPEAFMEAMEADLDQPNSAQRALLNFGSGDGESVRQLLFDSDTLEHRSSLTWAYETLAWFPDHAERAIYLLARLADTNVFDHHGGQPRQSLADLLKPWHCGSVLDSDRHCAVLRKLAKNHPAWAFDFVLNCLPKRHDSAQITELPLWRGRPDGAGSIRPEEHRAAVYHEAANILVQFAGTSESSVRAAIEAVDNLPEKETARVWKRVCDWADSEGCGPEERVRLVRHLTALADGALIHHRRKDNREAARQIVEKLSAAPVPVPALWLFDDSAVIRERHPEDAGLEATQERLEQKQRLALQDLRESCGTEAILSLVGEVSNAFMLGSVASRVLPTDEIHSAALKALQSGGDADQSPMRRFIQGLLEGIDEIEADALLDVIRSSSFAEQNPNWLPCVLARLPFGLSSARADQLSGEELKHYWKQFDSSRHVIPSQRKDWLIAGLCSAVRPRAALSALRGEFEGTRTESLRLLIETLPQSREEVFGHWEKELVAAIRIRPDLSLTEAARIEFNFFDVFDPGDMPALATAVASNPSWFKEALMLCVRRRDHADDPPEWRERIESCSESLRLRAYHLFKWLPRLPGTTSNGYDVDLGIAWTTAILDFAGEHNRREVAETLLGYAFGSAGFHEDGSPKDELADLLERVQCPRIEEGVAANAGDQREGVFLPDDDAGRPFRDRAGFYRELEKKYLDSAPRMARVVRLLRRSFDSQARMADEVRRLDEHRDAQS